MDLSHEILTRVTIKTSILFLSIALVLLHPINVVIDCQNSQSNIGCDISLGGGVAVSEAPSVVSLVLSLHCLWPLPGPLTPSPPDLVLCQPTPDLFVIQRCS